MRPEEHLDWLYRRQRLGVTLGLERILALLAAAGDPQRTFRSVLVGGTNGKGSTAKVLAECLTRSCERVGLYTSPHLSRIGERFVVDGTELGREDVAEAVGSLRPIADEIEASFFEVVTAAACLLFARERVGWAVMEVGLGGRFDATNALDPELSVVTGVALDHTDLLGETVALIAREKAGILRQGRPALTGASGDALVALRDAAAVSGAPLWVLGEEIVVRGEQLGWQGQRIAVTCPAGSVEAVSPLVGEHQQPNLALAAVAALRLGVRRDAVEQGLARARWPGRLERIRWRGRWVVFDGAHNAEAAAVLAKSLARLEEEPFTLVAGMGSDKDIAALVTALAPLAGTVFATGARQSPRARPPRDVAEAFGGDALPVDDPVEALDRAVAATRVGGTVVVAGSLYLVGELRPHVTGEGLETAERWQ